MSEASSSTTGTPLNPEGYRPDEAVRRGISHLSVAYHGLGAHVHSRRIRRSERLANQTDHMADFFEALGEIATQVAEEGEDLPPVQYDALGRTTPVKGREHRKDFPQEGSPSPPKQESVLSLQATSHRRASIYRDKRSIILKGSDLPQSERKGQPQVTFVRESQAKEPGEPGYDPNQIVYPDPQTQEERLAEKRLVSQVHKIRELRKAQATRRRMTGNTGRHAFWRTQWRHAGESLSDRRAFRDGKISASEARERALARKTDVTTVMHRRLSNTANTLGSITDSLVGNMGETADWADKKYGETEDKISGLQAKVNSHETKRLHQRNKTAKLSRQRAIRKTNNARRRQEKRKVRADSRKEFRKKISGRASNAWTSAKKKLSPQDKS